MKIKVKDGYMNIVPQSTGNIGFIICGNSSVGYGRVFLTPKQIKELIKFLESVK